MKGLSFILIASMIMISSCSHLEGLPLDEDVTQIIFFTDESNYVREAPYYDAIVELKQEFPKEFNNMIVLTKDNASKYYDFFKVNQSPAILIYSKGEILLKVKGNVTKEQIIQPFSNVLSKDQF